MLDNLFQCFSKQRKSEYDVKVKINNKEESSEIEKDISASEKSDENEGTTKNQSKPVETSELEIRGKSSTDLIKINTEDVVQVQKSSSLRDFVSLSLSVGAEDIDIGENDDNGDNTRNSTKSPFGKKYIKRASSFFQGKSTVDNKNQSPEDDNTILARRKEYTPNQELENVNPDKIIPIESTASKALDESEIHSNTSSKPDGPDGSSFVESFRHSKW